MDINQLIKTTEKLKVLYIEDDIAIQEDTKSIFDNLFLSTDIANDGKEGFEKYKDFYKKRKNFYDLVISDINMPNMDGIQMSEKILEINKNQAILVLSAYNDSDKLVKLIDIGVSNFIHKPMEMNTLFNILDKVSKNIEEYRDFEKNFEEIKKINTEYNSIINNYDKFVIATRTDLEGNFVDVSKAYEIISGYDKEELLGKNASILRHKDTSSNLYYEMWNDIKDGRIWSGEIQNIKKNGDSYWISSVVSPYMDKSNKVIGFNAISEDITKQKQIETLSLKIKKKNDKLKDLLDNTNQGFLSCSKNMLIENDYSLKCEEILGENLENKDISILLFNDDYKKQDTFRFGFNLIVNEEDILKQEQFFSLMPKEHYINDLTIKIEYKSLPNNRIMLILTNVSENKKLEEKIENERIVYRMVISVIINNSQFWEIKEEFSTFVSDLMDKELDDKFIDTQLPQILYSLHTFKGLFSQKDLIYTPKGIHDFEKKLQNLIHNKDISLNSLKDIIKNNGLKESLNKDIVLITNILGEDFLSQSSYIKIDVNNIFDIERKIKLMLQNETLEKTNLEKLLKDVNHLKNHRLVDILNSYSNQVRIIAEKQLKKIYKVDITCDKHILLNNYNTNFIKSLVHVFRNAIIHGIEKPDIRESFDKNKYGRITCKVIERKDSLIIKISDDGIGLNFDLIKKKALTLGYEKSKLDVLSEDKLINLIFNDNLSTYEQKNEYAGCGVGLGAVNEELKKINGTCNVKNNPLKGVILTFTIPFNKDK